MIPTLQDELETLLNRHSAENASNTPDYVLAEYMMACLAAFNVATQKRDKHKDSQSKEA